MYINTWQDIILLWYADKFLQHAHTELNSKRKHHLYCNVHLTVIISVQSTHRFKYLLLILVYFQTIIKDNKITLHSNTSWPGFHQWEIPIPVFCTFVIVPIGKYHKSGTILRRTACCFLSTSLRSLRKAKQGAYLQ